MTQKLKVRAYAIFQFISFIAIILSLLSFALIAFVISKEVGVNGTLFDKELWMKYIKEVMTFHSGAIGISASLLAYCSIILFVASWIFGWLIFQVHNRNLFDSLFLLFIVLPIVSNLFAFLGQVSAKEIKFASSKINKKHIIQEQTRLINIEEKTNIENSKDKKKSPINK